MFYRTSMVTTKSFFFSYTKLYTCLSYRGTEYGCSTANLGLHTYLYYCRHQSCSLFQLCNEQIRKKNEIAMILSGGKKHHGLLCFFFKECHQKRHGKYIFDVVTLHYKSAELLLKDFLHSCFWLLGSEWRASMVTVVIEKTEV